MINFEWFLWILFLLFFAVIPIKPLFEIIFANDNTRKIIINLEEENNYERHSSQFYRLGDKKYDNILQLSNSAKLIN